MNKGLISIVKNDYIITVACKVFGVLIAILYSSLSARYLGAELKGEIAYINGYTSIISIILTLGVHQAYPYFRKQNGNSDIKNAFMNCVLFMCIFYLLIVSCFCVLSKCNYNTILIALLSPLLAYSRIVGYVYLVESPAKKNLTYLFVEFLQVIYVLLLLLFAQRNLILGISIFVFLDLILSISYTVKLKLKFKPSNLDPKFLWKIISYGILPMISLLTSTLNYRIDVLMLHEYNNVLLSDIGIYSIGVSLAERVLLVPEAIKEILLSKLAKGAHEETVAKVMRMCMPICLIILLGILILGQPFINFLYGSEFENSYTITVITMFGVTAIMFYKMIATYNIVNKKQLFNLIFLISSIVVNIIMNSILIPMYSITGAAISTVISYIYCAIVFLTYFSRRTGIKMRNLIFINKNDLDIIRNFLSKRRQIK